MNIVESEQTARPSMKERQRQLREDAILDAAVEFIRIKGFSSMTLEDITDAIGISRPTLYQHFSSKEDLLVSVSVRNIKLNSQKLQEMDPSRPAADRLREFIAWCIDRRFGSDPKTTQDIMRFVISFGCSDPRFIEPHVAFMGELEALIAQAQKEGGVRSDIRPVVMAEMAAGAIKHIAFDRLVKEGITNATEISDGLIKLLFAKGE